MNTDMTLQIKCTSSEDTEQLGKRIGASLRGGEIIELKSDLGGGKTTLTRGLAEGAQSTDDVASPTFTISRIYSTPHFAIHHFDFYRLEQPGLLSHELQELFNDNKVVLVIEWGDIVADILPAERITISINHTGDMSRDFDITIPKQYAYIAEACTV